MTNKTKYTDIVLYNSKSNVIILNNIVCAFISFLVINRNILLDYHNLSNLLSLAIYLILSLITYINVNHSTIFPIKKYAIRNILFMTIYFSLLLLLLLSIKTEIMKNIFDVFCFKILIIYLVINYLIFIVYRINKYKSNL